MKSWNPKAGGKLTIIGEPPPLFRHFITESKTCPECGEESSTVRNRCIPVSGVEMCDCCFARVLEKAAKGETLTQALKSLGLGHRPGKFPSQRIIFDVKTREELGHFTSQEGWDLVHQRRTGS